MVADARLLMQIDEAAYLWCNFLARWDATVLLDGLPETILARPPPQLQMAALRPIRSDGCPVGTEDL